MTTTTTMQLTTNKMETIVKEQTTKRAKKAKLPFSYLGSVNSSSKIQKTDKELSIDTFVMYLAPWKLSGYNVCFKATAACILACLDESGRSRMDGSFSVIRAARIARTKCFFEQKDIFMEKLFREIRNAKNRTAKKEKGFAVRLNGTSDLSPVQFKQDGKNILETFSDVQFYDYTKVLNRIELTKKHANYDLTFSYTGENWNECKIAIDNNVRVAVVFNVAKGKALPATWNGVTVIDGDTYDYRPIDAKGCIVGLRFKQIRKEKNEVAKNSIFVVQPAQF